MNYQEIMEKDVGTYNCEGLDFKIVIRDERLVIVPPAPLGLNSQTVGSWTPFDVEYYKSIGLTPIEAAIPAIREMVNALKTQRNSQATATPTEAILKTIAEYNAKITP